MTAHYGPGWRLAPSLIQLETEANLYAPDRLKISDGSIGDADHLGRGSLHNSIPFVRALDLTHSPERGFDAVVVADLIAARCEHGWIDPITGKRVYEERVLGIGSYNWATRSERWFAKRNGVWDWIDQDLQGASHKTHMHLAVVDDARKLDTRPWGLLAPPTPQQEDEGMIVQLSDTGAYYQVSGTHYISGGLQPQSLGEKFKAAGVSIVKLTTDELKKNFIKLERP